MSDLRVHKTKYINETKRVSFKYDGKNYFGYEGDTLASALLANGVPVSYTHLTLPTIDRV